MKLRSLLSLALLAAIGSTARADMVANFDSFSEGQWFDTFIDNGIRFHSVFRHQGGYTNFAFEDATGGDLAGYTAPNALGFGGYVPGSGVAFGAFGGMTFTSDTEATTAGLDLWTFPLDMGGNTLTLQGFKDGNLVDSVSYTFGNSFTVLHRRLDLPTDTYDTFKLVSSGPSVMGDSFIDVDNVTVAAVPEPATLAALGLGVAALLKRRRR